MKLFLYIYFLILLTIMLSIIWFAEFSKLEMSLAFILFAVLLAFPTLLKYRSKNSDSDKNE